MALCFSDRPEGRAGDDRSRRELRGYHNARHCAADRGPGRDRPGDAAVARVRCAKPASGRAARAPRYLARWTQTLRPAPGDVERRPRNRACSGSSTPVRTAATLPRRRTAPGAPLLQPSGPIAHCRHPRQQRSDSSCRNGQGSDRRARAAGAWEQPLDVQIGRSCLLNWASKRRFRDLLAQKDRVRLVVRRTKSTRLPGKNCDGETRT